MATSLTKEEIKFAEHLFSINEFNRPKVVYNHEAISTLLMYLALLDPTTFQTRPGMGLGLNTIWKWHFEKDVNACASEYKRQIETYLPWFQEVEVYMKLIDHELRIFIFLDSEQFQMVLNLQTKTLSSL